MIKKHKLQNTRALWRTVLLVLCTQGSTCHPSGTHPSEVSQVSRRSKPGGSVALHFASSTFTKCDPLNLVTFTVSYRRRPLTALSPLLTSSNSI